VQPRAVHHLLTQRCRGRNPCDGSAREASGRPTTRSAHASSHESSRPRDARGSRCRRSRRRGRGWAPRSTRATRTCSSSRRRSCRRTPA